MVRWVWKVQPPCSTGAQRMFWYPSLFGKHSCMGSPSSVSPFEYPGSQALGTKWRHELSGLASVSAAQSVTYFAMPSALNVEDTSGGTPRGTQSSGCRSRCGEKPLVLAGSTRKPTMSILKEFPVASFMISDASKAMAQASSYIAKKVGGQPCRSKHCAPSASVATSMDHLKDAAGNAAKPSSTNLCRTSVQLERSTTSGPRRSSLEAWNFESSMCKPGQIRRQ
mmetsp:Transcript_113483/g.360725  ORF Transcript_113483/g.360725 Transcript_113483/m.360725 type:complete len:224 (-) Transcript_113483:168-839(-)